MLIYAGIDATREFNIRRFNIPQAEQDLQFIIDRRVPEYRNRTGFLMGGNLKPSIFWEFISDKDAPTYFSVIQSWFYDHRINLFVIKRKEGCQYMPKDLKYFRSLCESDLLDLGKRWFVNL